MNKIDLLNKIQNKEAVIGVIGLGYVGLPLIREFLKAQFTVVGFDVDTDKVGKINRGESYIKHIDPQYLKDYVFNKKKLSATSDFSGLSRIDCIIICVPTPLNAYREPDLSYILNATRVIASNMQKGQLIVLESTTYPGTTDEDMKEILESTGLIAGKDFYLAFSPEREDPNNPNFSTKTIPKVVGGVTPDCQEISCALYKCIIDKIVPVSSTKAAEATKLLENIFRSVNIALVNEMKMLFDRMGIDVWEVIGAASTKPFGYMPFYPGPGLGGHCIPVDPFYLTWKAREYDFSTKFIELAGEINTHMPYYVIERIQAVLNNRGKSLKGANILALGIAYKKDIDDQRESPSLKVVHLLKQNGADVHYNDPYIPYCSGHGHYPDIDMHSTALTENSLAASDLIVLLTDHTSYDYSFIEKHAQCIVDTRGAFRTKGLKSDKIHTA